MVTKKFGDTVTTALQELLPEARLTPSALQAIRYFLEEYILGTLKLAEACREHAGREELQVEDLQLIEILRRRRCFQKKEELNSVC